MIITKKTWIASALLAGSVVSAHASVVAVDCSKKTLMSVITKLDKSVPNTVNISGSCTEDVVVSGFKDLTLVGTGGASINSAGPTGTGTTLLIGERGQVTVQSITLSGGSTQVATCTGRSSCVFRDVTVTGGANGIALQDQSYAEILGTSVIANSQGTGIGVFGASTVNIRPEIPGGVGPVISGHAAVDCDNSVTPPQCFPIGIGAMVQDGSFLRADNSTFSGNGAGIIGQRGAVIKVYTPVNGGVTNNMGDGISVRWGSIAAIGAVISGNGGAGVKVGSLTHFHDQGVTFSGNGQDVACTHSTAISQPSGWCGH